MSAAATTKKPSPTAALLEKPATAAVTETEPTAAPARAIPNAADLAERAKAVKEQQASFLDEMRNAYDYHVGQAEEIKTLLADLGQPINGTSDDDAGPVVIPSKTGRGTGPRKGRETTIAGAVESLVLKYKNGLGRGELTAKMSSEMGYEIGEGAEAAKKFANNVYTGGIVKLMAEGKVITVGQRPNTVYKHITNASKLEIEAFKASKQA